VKPAGNQISYDPTTLFLTGRMPFLPPNQQPQSTEGKFLITPTLLTTGKPEPETAGASELQYLLDVVLQGGFLQYQRLGAVDKTEGNI